jgi:hypothetical protein
MGKKGAGISMANKGAAGEESVVLPEQKQEIKEAAPKKRNPCPGVRLIGKRIYDPENGKTCHQVSTCCRPSHPFWICRFPLGHRWGRRIWLIHSCFGHPLAVPSENNGLCGGLQAAAEEGALSNPLLPQVPAQQVQEFLLDTFSLEQAEPPGLI